ncbi:hypothetical protein [uncultured Sphingomonas sp.]|uniref:hypothetical protein n=1 Tax=uncultured Sphingomonas sp. TaxID=158754 RepID=UPI00261184EA|nr:hypothetical protein [uncultured Sphingomonas sp.]
MLLRARDFGNPAIHVDEEYYLLVGDRMLHGTLPYLGIWDRKPVGLFLIFAAIRLIPGDGILVYQLVATLFAAVTAWVVARAGQQLGAGRGGTIAAAICYILWLSLLSGRGGQSPVFYNLFVAGGGLLTLRLPQLATRRDRRAIVINGAAACLLAGLAIQTKYTPVVEGAFFGLAHLWYLRRAGASLFAVGGAAILWAALGLAPTALAVAYYYERGSAVFQAFWFANFVSVGLRRGYPAAKIAARLAGTTTQLAPFALIATLHWRDRPRRAETILACGWLAAALVAFVMIGAFFDHYALPLMVPLAIVAAPVLGRHRAALVATLGWGVALLTFHIVTEPDEGTSARAIARVIKADSGAECPFVFAGDSILYYLAGTCLPTAYAFPSTLAYDAERGASGIDETAEVRRIMTRRPPVVVTMDHPLAPWNLATHAVVARALAQGYRLIMVAPRGADHLLVYLRRDIRRVR